MTKDVELHSGTWKKMNSALTGLTENSSVSSSGYGSYTNAQAGSYLVGTSSTGFAKRIEELVEISERAKRLINEKDTDGVVSFRYHDESSNAQTLQSKLGALEKYSANVSKYLKEKIDQPFYEAMDKVGAKLEALSIQNYKTTNTVGYKRTDVIRDEYGNKVGTMEVTPKEIGIDELYKVESPYKAALQKSYEEFKNSETYKEHKLTQDEYLMAMHHTRAFEYESIDDQKSKTELWRDLALGAGVIVLTIFCPPAGAVAGTALAAADMYSAASGKDWGTGRELDGTERGLRAAFSLFDLIPAGKYLSGLVKTGKNAGIVGVKTSLKTALKEGLEQGAKNLDNFKGVLRNAKSFGDTILSKVKTYGQQLDNLRPSKVLSKSAESLSNGLRHADNVLSEAAQNFRLNMGLEPQLVGGTMPSGGGKLSHLADNLSAFAKNLDGSVDEVMEAGSKAGETAIKHGDDVPRLKEIEVNFNRNVKYNEPEFARQLADQEKGMNKLTVKEYLDNRERYIAEGRAIEGNAAQKAARENAFSDKYNELVESGMSRSEAKTKAQEWLDTQAALHNPDQIAGGYADQIGGMGDKKINSSIGSQWKYRIDAVDEQIQALAEKMTPEQLQTTYLNVRLTY